MINEEKLTEMISVSLTPSQLEALEVAVRASGLNKVGTYARTVLIRHLKAEGLLDITAVVATDDDDE